MKLPVALKSLLIVAALASAGSAVAVTSSPSLPMVTAETIVVQVSSFLDTFSFYVPTLSKFSAHLGSSDLSFGPYALPAVHFNFVELSTGAQGSVSNTGATHSSDISAVLAEGTYSLTVHGYTYPSTSELSLPLPVGGLYTIYGTLAPVPEPESYAMFLAGLGVIGAVARRRQNKI